MNKINPTITATHFSGHGFKVGDVVTFHGVKSRLKYKGGFIVESIDSDTSFTIRPTNWHDRIVIVIQWFFQKIRELFERMKS